MDLLYSYHLNFPVWEFVAIWTSPLSLLHLEITAKYADRGIPAAWDYNFPSRFHIVSLV